MHFLRSFLAFSYYLKSTRSPRRRWGPLQLLQSRIYGSTAVADGHRLAREATRIFRRVGVSWPCAILLVLAGPLHSVAGPADADMANRYLRAAEQGDPAAQVYVAALYSAGVGFRQSDRDAFQWFLRAAEQGNDRAELVVAGLYAIGRGTSKDNVSAYRWASAASNAGDANVRGGAKQLMEALATRMSEDERSAAIKQSETGSSGGGAATSPQTQSGQSSQGRYGSLEGNPRDAVAYYNRALARVRAQEYALAVEDFGKVIELNPNDAEALNNRCWARAVLGRLDGALSDCDEALRLRPNYADALDSRGLVNLKLGNLDRAISDYNAALRLKPDLASALYGRGKARLRQGADSRGNADIKSAKDRDPNIEKTFSRYGVN